MTAEEIMRAAQQMPQRSNPKTFREQLVESITEFEVAINRRKQLLALMDADPKIEEFIALSKEI